MQAAHAGARPVHAVLPSGAGVVTSSAVGAVRGQIHTDLTAHGVGLLRTLALPGRADQVRTTSGPAGAAVGGIALQVGAPPITPRRSCDRALAGPFHTGLTSGAGQVTFAAVLVTGCQIDAARVRAVIWRSFRRANAGAIRAHLPGAALPAAFAAVLRIGRDPDATGARAEQLGVAGADAIPGIAALRCVTMGAAVSAVIRVRVDVDAPAPAVGRCLGTADAAAGLALPIGGARVAATAAVAGVVRGDLLSLADQAVVRLTVAVVVQSVAAGGVGRCGATGTDSRADLLRGDAAPVLEWWAVGWAAAGRGADGRGGGDSDAKAGRAVLGTVARLGKLARARWRGIGGISAANCDGGEHRERKSRGAALRSATVAALRHGAPVVNRILRQ